MNNGKICISVCAETVVELVEQIKRAGDLADVVEIRFDCLKSAELQKTKFKLPDFRRIFLVAFRPQEQGGKRDFTMYERLNFWKAIFWINRQKEFLVDLEFDINEAANFGNSRTIISYHDFTGKFENLFHIYNLLTSTNENILKIAVQANDITDTIPIWKLLEKAKSDGKQIIPIAMGESGKWTRILGLAHGAFMTYAALDAGRETAPGQISAKDLIEVYRVKELDENTEIYGIIGGNTSYSMSPYIHNAAFKFHKLNAVFVPLQMQNLDEFIKRMVKPETREIDLNFKGFAVTIPHKQNIIKHLDFLGRFGKKNRRGQHRENRKRKTLRLQHRRARIYRAFEKRLRQFKKCKSCNFRRRRRGASLHLRAQNRRCKSYTFRQRFIKSKKSSRRISS